MIYFKYTSHHDDEYWKLIASQVIYDKHGSGRGRIRRRTWTPHILRHGPTGLTTWLGGLGRAYALMSKDKAYLDEAEKRGVSLGRPMEGEALQALVERTFASASQDVVREYLSYTEEGD